MAGNKRSPRRSGGRSDTAGKFGSREGIVVVLLFIALGGWGIASLFARNSGQGDRGELRQSANGEATGVIPGGSAPDFTIETVDGSSFRLSEHRGRVIVLDFLAPG